MNGKYIAVVLVLILVCYHGLRNHLYPYDSCSALFQEGTYLGPGTWQPDGCTMHHYSIKETPKCFKDENIVVVGDSRMRQLYFSLVKILTVQTIEEGKIHADIHHHEKETNTDIDFWWQPELNDSTTDVLKTRLLQAQRKPLFVVLGAGTWTIKLNQGSPDGLKQFQNNLTKIAPTLAEVAQNTPLIWMLQAPVQAELLSDTRQMITNAQVDLYNGAAESILSSTDVVLWRSAVTAASESHEDTLDGLHLSEETIHTDIQLLLNRFCNIEINPSDATCCSRPLGTITFLQKATFGIFTAAFVFSLYFKLQLNRRKRAALSSSSNHVDVEASNHIAATDPKAKETPHWLDTAFISTSHLARYGLVMAYFFICDRTDLFPKRQKHYSSDYFMFSLLVALIISLFLHADTKKPTVLNLDQTREWKGWMQICILIYHYCGASKVIPIYMHLRLMVASYLFMTAYGQFCASWDKNKFGLPRLCNVVFRMNLLVFFLCLVMDRQYQLYYFVPLVSFWFLVIYTTMAIFPRVTGKSAEATPRHYLYMLSKLGVLFTIITLLGYSQLTFNLVFGWWPFSELFMWPDTSIYEWWFRWNLDKYIVPYGMFFSLALLSARSQNWLDDGHSGGLFSMPKSILVHLVAATVFVLSTYHSCLCTSKPECNAVHSYTSFLPITAFILLRNSSGFLRQKFSVFAAWFGDISLELFISQYHIWLARDTKALLVLVPGFPTINLIVTSFIFVCVAIEIKDLTGVLTSIAIPNEPRALYPRLVFFVALLSFLLIYANYFGS